MATGYDETGTDELLCGAPPDAGVEEFVPNCTSGMFPAVWSYFPTYNFSTTDFSYEFWYHWALGDSNTTSDVFSVIGAADDPGALGNADAVALVRLSNTAYQMRLEYNHDPGNGATLITSLWSAVPGPEDGWLHCVAQFDRSGNMELVINTISIVTQAINNNALGTRMFMPLVGNNGNDLSYNPTAWDYTYNAFEPTYETGWGTFTQCRGRLGPISLHNRLMTDAEILESFQERRVQDIATVTQIKWDWTDVTGNDTWDFDETHIVASIRSSLGTPMGIPEAAAAAVTVPDTSGNSNAITIPTRAAYADVAGALNGTPDVRGWMAFLSDPFWR